MNILQVLSLSTLLIITACGDRPIYDHAPEGYKCLHKSQGYIDFCKPGQIPRKTICEQDKRAEFILKCAKAANPMSDEEGEDLVEQCELTSHNLYCKTVNFKINKR